MLIYIYCQTVSELLRRHTLVKYSGVWFYKKPQQVVAYIQPQTESRGNHLICSG